MEQLHPDSNGQLPEYWFIERLSAEIGKAATSIRTYATSKTLKHLIPPAYKLPHSNRLCWLAADVIAWKKGAKRVNPKVGRPTKAERIAKNRTAAAGATDAHRG